MRTVLFVLLLGFLALPIKAAHACGCFAPPDVSQPLVQAGEEIVFAVDNGQITMHVKIRYSGRAGDFGWIVPLPSAPTDSNGMPGFDIGADELFSQLEARTQPTYALQRIPCFQSSTPSIGCGGGDALSGAYADGYDMGASNSPLVKQSTVGPYDYAILKADNKTAMLQWLSDNHYVVPAGTDTAINPYIHPGAYLLALKLHAGAQIGDLQPVVLRYPGDLPMIPITLTSVGATPNMGILIWVLGNGRAIPRNYAHTVINDAQLDWLHQVKNYNDVIIRAVAEAPGKHAFVTEFAGARDIMYGVLDSPHRFDVLNTAMTQSDPVLFIQTIQPQDQPQGDDYTPYTTFSRVTQGFALNGQFFAVVGAHIPMPQQLITEGVTPGDYYQRIDFYLRTDRAQRPAAYADIEAKLAAFNPAALAADLRTRIANPTMNAGTLFSTLPTITRLYTTLSPEDMTVDPVFSFNPGLPNLSNFHTGTFNARCDGGGTLRTDAGLERAITQEESNQDVIPLLPIPASLRIESLSDNGQPTVLTDNTQAIQSALPKESTSGCAASTQRRSSGSGYLALCGLAMTALLLRRRRLA